MSIPKIIWQTHESKYEDLPDLYKENSQTYKDLGWDYRYCSALDRESFIAENFPEYLHLYLYIKPGIYRSDLWRYLVLSKYGGFYADMDSRLDYKKGSAFDKTIHDPNATFNVVCDPRSLFNNYAIMCSPNNPIMEEIVKAVTSKCQEFYDEQNEIFPDYKWVYATGPKMYASVINKHIDKISYFYNPRDEGYDFGVRHYQMYKHEIDKDT
jgi:inositol phosphorylceramide mannosyltransferase catalytic subunit